MGIVNARRPEGGAHAQHICVPAASLVPLARMASLAAISKVSRRTRTGFAHRHCCGAVLIR